MVGDSKVDGKEDPFHGIESPFDVRPAKKASRKSRYLLAALLIPLYLGATFYKYRVGQVRHEQVSALLEAAQCPVQPIGYRSVMSQWVSYESVCVDRILSFGSPWKDCRPRTRSSTFRGCRRLSRWRPCPTMICTPRTLCKRPKTVVMSAG